MDFCKIWYEQNAVGFEVLAAVSMKSVLLWLVTPYSSDTTSSFGGTYRLQLQG
jgi:hypothetical protein